MKTHASSVQEIWISGVNPVKEALLTESLPIEEMFIARADARGDELLQLAKQRRITIRSGSRDALSQIVGHSHHQGVALRAGEYPYISVDSFLAGPMENREPLIILDSIQDPQNLGALIRSACFLGAKGIILPKDRSARVTSAVIKVAAGATAYLPVIQVVNLARALDELKEAGIWIAGLDVHGSRPIYDADLTMPLGLVVGNEQKGLRPLIRKACDLLIQIPARGPLDSLNAATAGAIALAEVQRQRKKP